MISVFTRACEKEYNIEIESIEPFEPIDSAEVTPHHWKLLAQVIQKNYELYESFVIVHGTNTMVQTALALNLILGNIAKPVILTGSQKSMEKASTDAITNFGAAFALAAYNEKQIKGAVIVFQNKIISGLKAVKTSNEIYNAFSTFGGDNDLGKFSAKLEISDDELAKHNANFGNARKSKDLDMRPEFCTDGGLQPYIIHAGFNPRTIFDDLKHKPYIKAFLLSCSGDGDPNLNIMTDTLNELRKRKIPCIITSHSTDGATYMVLNEPGVNARKLGAIPSGIYNPITASDYISWLIAQSCSYENFEKAMKLNRNEVVKLLQTQSKK